MIVRIVKMIFKEEEVASFQSFFQQRQAQIKNFEGCHHVELWQDKHHASTFFTYSIWQSEEHLNAYRQSPFFKETWQLTRQKFADKAKAWTVEKVY